MPCCCAELSTETAPAQLLGSKHAPGTSRDAFHQCSSLESEAAQAAPRHHTHRHTQHRQQCCHLVSHSSRMVWAGRNLKAHPVPLPAMEECGIVALEFHYPRLPQALSNPEHFQGWGSRSFSGQPLPGLSHPHREQHSVISVGHVSRMGCTSMFPNPNLPMCKGGPEHCPANKLLGTRNVLRFCLL